MVVVGAASRDIDPRDPRGWRLGGGVSYGAMAVARLGVRVGALVGVDEQAAEATEIDALRNAGVEVRLVRLTRAPVFENRETSEGRTQVAHSASDPLRADVVPPEWRAAPCFVLSPVAGELAAEWATALPATALVALGWQGLYRRIVAGADVAALPLARLSLADRADLAVVSADDARAGGAQLASLLRQGQQLVVTDGAHGALHLERVVSGVRARYLPALPVARVADPTGAGDALLAIWAAIVAVTRLRGITVEPWRALALAVAAASATVERVGIEQTATLRELCAKLRVASPPPSGSSRRL
ncbi:MAG TPA: PfkB family carbohydrate kinase [Candidatus Limnocylindrales bacterium]